MAGCKVKGKNDWVEFSAFVRDQVFYFVFQWNQAQGELRGRYFFVVEKHFLYITSQLSDST